MFSSAAMYAYVYLHKETHKRQKHGQASVVSIYTYVQVLSRKDY